MNEKLLQIINYYGVDNQLKLKYGVTEEEIESVKDFKTDRQLKRIEESK